MDDELLIPKELDNLLIAICADYLRRAEVISSRSAPYNVVMEYRFMNYRIMNAAVEIAGSRDALVFIYDIGNDVGYTSSSLTVLSEKLYKKRKKEVKENIARRRSLL